MIFTLRSSVLFDLPSIGTDRNVPRLSLVDIGRLWGLVFAVWCCSHAHHALAQETVGPVIGSVGPSSAQILYRPAAMPQQLRLTLLDEQRQTVQVVEANTTEEHDYVVKFQLTGLSPNTKYFYQIDTIDGDRRITVVAADDEHHLSTSTPDRTGHKVTIGFVSCVDIEPNALWSEMERVGVDAICLMGDTPYIDSSNLQVARERHRQFLQIPGLAKLAKRTPIVGTWDDHDFGLNNGNGLNMLQGKPVTRRAFVEYRAHDQYGDEEQQEGVYHRIDLGMIEVFLLDPRYFSQTAPSPVDPQQTTCFGEKQWNWLGEGLRDSQAPFKVLAMGAIWQDKKNSETDDMFTYWYERDALFDLIKREKISGVTLLGGDIHVSRYLRHPQRVGYDLHDFIVSPGHDSIIPSLNVYHPSLEWSHVEGNQFLTLTADGTGPVPKLIATYRQPDGQVNHQVEIDLSQMTPPAEEKERDPDLRGHWNFNNQFSNQSAQGQRLDLIPVGDPQFIKGPADVGQVIQLERAAQQFLNIPRNGLDDNSAAHTLSLWFRPNSLPTPGTTERMFLFESTAEGPCSAKSAWHLSLGFRAGDRGLEDQVNLQLYTQTLQRATKPGEAPTAISQGPFDCLLDRKLLLEQWNQVVVVFDSQSWQIYLNGASVAKHALPIPGPAAEFGGVILGGHREGQGRNFDGWLDELSIWQKTLSPTEIQSLYKRQTSQFNR